MNGRLPGFTADAGLDAPSGRYQQVAEAQVAAGFFSPAQRLSSLPGRGGRPCVPCKCVSPDGCPCCNPGPITLPGRRTTGRLR
jgi:hypothetical protein